MATTQAAQPVHDSDAACWRDAVQLYNAQRKKGSASKKYIHLGSVSNSQDGSKDRARELMATAIRSYQGLQEKRGPIAVMVIHIYNNLRQYARAVDVFVQCEPTIAAIVWGSVRVLLQIGEEEERASEIAGEGILEIIRHAGRWEQVSALADLLNSHRLRRALVALYLTVLDFSQSSTQWLGRGTIQRLGISILSSKRGKFESKLNEMRKASDLVDRELQTQGTYQGLGSLNKMTSDVQIVMDKIDRVLDEVKHLSDYTMQLQLDSALLTLTQENISTVRSVLSELQSLPASMTHAIVGEMQGLLDLTRIKQWLSLSAVETSPPDPRMDDTCFWLPQHPSFLTWSRSEGSLALWIQGHQGCGKSVMAGYLQERLRGEGQKTLFYRFQRSASSAQSTPTSFSSSLISQLLDVSARIPMVNTSPYHQLQSLATQFPLGPQNCGFKMLWDLAVTIFKMLRLQFILIIDAMDECLFDDSSYPKCAAFLDTLSHLMGETRSKLLIFTRPDPIFATAVQTGHSIFLSNELLLPDIMTFATKEYGELGLPPSEKDQILSVISSSSQGSFRWTAMFLHHLAQSLQMADLRARMWRLPPSLTELYRQSLLDGAQGLSAAELECRRALFLIMFQTQQPLRTAEVADALSLRPERADMIISGLCKPLASSYGGFIHFSHPSVREFFDVYHQQDDHSLGISFADSHSLLAERCLTCLLDKRYADLHLIGKYLLASYSEQGSLYPDTAQHEGPFFDYAMKFWDYHLVRTSEPSKSLLQQVNSFILGLQFVYWTERSRQSRQDYTHLVRVNVTFAALKSWLKGLSDQDQAVVEIDKFFERCYNRLADVLQSSRTDGILPWLARMAVGDFYFIAGFTEKVCLLRPHILAALQTLLGPRHRLTLRAKSDAAHLRVHTGRMIAARRMYTEVVNIQRDVLGENSSQFLDTLSLKGQTEYFMTDFVAAVLTWTKVSVGALGLLGPDHFLYIVAQMWYAQAMVYMGQPEPGLQTLQSLLERRREVTGADDGFVNVAQLYVGEILLLLGRYEESIAALDIVLIWRRGYYPLSNIYRLDAEITLAFAYYAAGRDEEAVNLVKQVEEEALNLYFEFQRYCQVAHVKGLLLAKAGSLDEAIHLLQDTITQAYEDQGNRALLWIRLDLATLLRKRDAEGDRDQASANFDNLVKDVSGENDPGFPDEPDPPRFLAVAERALRLVRAGKDAEARRELDSEQLDWRRPSDLWLWLGGTFYRDMIRIIESDLRRDN